MRLFDDFCTFLSFILSLRSTLVSDPSRINPLTHSIPPYPLTPRTKTKQVPSHQPNLLEDLYTSTDKVPQKLDAKDAKTLDIPKRNYLDDEALYRFDFNEDQMAVEKLREGISKFAADAITLKNVLREKIEKA